MGSTKDYMAEVKERFETLETQFTYERKNLNKIKELLTEDKEKWAKDIKETEARVKKTRKELEEKEAQLESCRKNFENVKKNVLSQEQENNKVEKDLQNEKKRLEENRDFKNKELAQLKEELEDTLDKIKTQKENNDYKKRQQDIDMNLMEGTGEKTLKERMIMLTNDLKRKEDELEQDLRALNAKMVADRKALWKVQDKITAAQLECDDLIKKNQKLRDQIDLVENFA